MARLLYSWILVLWTALSGVAHGDPAAFFQNDIRPLLKAHCFDCHGTEKTKGDLDLEAFADYAKVTEVPDRWQLVLERVQSYEMPPAGRPEMDDGIRQKLVGWLRGLPKAPGADCNQIASDRTASFYKGYVMSRRLNRAEYRNTLRDLFGIEFNVQDLLPADGSGGEGFDTAGSALFTSSLHIEKYLAAADHVLDTVFGDSRKPEVRKARERILPARPGLFTNSRDAARRNIETFARRAFRRPVGAEEVDRFMTLFDHASKRGDSFTTAMKLPLQAVLVSPHFLFLPEPEPAEGGGVQKLDPLPLASKLSYFIWSSMPDEELLALAESGRLLDDDVYRQQVRRMIADPKARALGERFALQWLDLQQLGTDVRPDAARFPEFDAELAASMHNEVIACFNYIVQNDRSLLELLDADYTFVNGRLARLYGLDTVTGPDLRKVQVVDRNRGGVIGMAAVHTLTSYPLRTSPVLRGRWVLESLLGERVPPPPPDVPALEEETPQMHHVSLRRQLELHRTKAECAACHDKMDPLGFGLENFDVLGRWRTEDRGQPIDATGKLPSGVTFSGPTGLKDVLLSRKDDVMKHLVRKMTGYAFGRELNKFDECVVDGAMAALKKENYRASLLIEQIAASAPFRHRFFPKSESDTAAVEAVQEALAARKASDRVHAAKNPASN